MANIASARKAARQSEKRRQHNASLRSELRSALKRVRKAIEAGDKAAARAVYERLDQGARFGRRQGYRAQEQGCAPQEPSRRRDQGDGVSLHARVGGHSGDRSLGSRWRGNDVSWREESFFTIEQI